MFPPISRCRACGNTQLTDILDLGVHALSNVFPSAKQQDVPRGLLRLVKCTGEPDVCGLLQLEHAYELHDSCEETYRDPHGSNPSKVFEVRSLRILERLAWKDTPIIYAGPQVRAQLGTYSDVECFVLRRASESVASSRTLQLLPTAEAPSRPARHTTRNAKHGAIVVSPYSILSHLEAPLRFMQEVRTVLDDDGVWLFDQAYLPTMLYRNAYDMVGHMRLGYYALRQIKWMADRVGLKIVDVEFTDSGAYTVSILLAGQRSGHTESAAVEEVLDDEAREGIHTLQPYRNFATRVASGATLLRTFLDRARTSGKSVYALGASSGGNVILQYCNVTSADIELVGEVDSDRVGTFTPGTLIPVVPEVEILNARPDYLVVLPWRLRRLFVEQPKFTGHSLLFPLPRLELVSPLQNRE